MATKEENVININPIRRGGFLSDGVREYSLKYLDGYSICDECEVGLQKIKNPPVCTVEEMLLKYYPMDRALITFGAREAMGIVTQALVEQEDIVVVDGNRHYVSILAVEKVGAEVIEVASSGSPEFKVDPDFFENTISDIIASGREKPKLIILTHVDGLWGNVNDVKSVAAIAQKYEIPMLLNAAYSAGRFSFNHGELGVDFVAVSGHKSFGSSGPVGALLYLNKWTDYIERMSKKYPQKNLNILGCSVRGVAAASFYKALTELEARLEKWPEEVKKTRAFVERMESIVGGGIIQRGIRPKEHDLINFDTPVLYEISQKHDKRGYFLMSELKKREIVGVKPGRTKSVKMSVYGLSDSEVDHVVSSFKEIIHGRYIPRKRN